MNRKIYFIIFIIAFGCTSLNFCHAQNPQLFGMTYGGGANSSGTIFKMNDDGSGFQTVYSFSTATGANPYGSLLQANDGKLYGMTSYGGANLYGALFRFDPVDSSYSDVFDFNLANGASPYGSLIQATNGELYGMTHGGGANSDGVLFSFDPVDSVYTKLIDLNDSIGAFPKGDLIEANDGKLYGMTAVEGRYNYGTLFSFDPANNRFDKLLDFDLANGKFPYGSLIKAGNNRLYGTTRDGGVDSTGVIFSFNPADSSYSKLFDLSGGNQEYPSSSLLLANDGKFYGMTLQGGLNNFGQVYSFDTTGAIYSTVQDFDSVNGASPNFNTLMQASNNKLYGMTVYGGASNDGVIFSFNPADSTYSKLIDFNGTNGKYPNGTLLEYQITTGIAGNNDKSYLAIYPNPARKELIITNAELRIKELDIYNLLGMKVYSSQSYPAGAGVNRKVEISIDISSLSQGIYFVKAVGETGGWQSVGKFVKE